MPTPQQFDRRDDRATQLDADAVLRLAAGLPASGLWLAIKEALRLPGFQFPAHMPNTPGQWRRFYRDCWIFRAHLASGWEADELATMWQVFCSSRGQYRWWRDECEPPDGASALQVALFNATNLNAGEPMCARSVRDVLGKK